jgi:hypothetical protein
MHIHADLGDHRDRLPLTLIARSINGTSIHSNLHQMIDALTARAAARGNRDSAIAVNGTAPVEITRAGLCLSSNEKSMCFNY